MIETVVYFLDGTGFGGTEQIVLDILAGLDRRRWRPVLLHYPELGLPPLLERARDLGVKLREVRPAFRHLSAMATQSLGWPGFIRELPGVAPFIRELRAENPAIFHAHLSYPVYCRGALTAAALAGVPGIVATVHLFPSVSLSGPTRGLQRLMAIFVNSYIAVSHDVARRLRQSFYIPARKIHVVRNGVSLPRFDVPANPALRVTLTRGTEPSIILVTGRLDEQKGHRYLLEAAALVPEAIFVIAGEGPERANLEALSRKLGVNNRVLFLGFRQDIPDLLACSDLFVLPSLFEGLSVSILEAMAAGKPVIASAIGGNDEVILHGKTGVLVPPADPAALATAIRAVMSDPQLAQRLAAAGKELVRERFSAAEMVDRVMQIYDHSLSLFRGPNARR